LVHLFSITICNEIVYCLHSSNLKAICRELISIKPLFVTFVRFKINLS